MLLSLTDQQFAFVRFLVESGQYSSTSAVLQQALEFQHQTTDAEITTKALSETQAFSELLQHRLNGPMISTAEMTSRVEAMIERKRLSV
ncbi:antitoxin ParD1/3/4 [Rhizobium sp. BK060]|nr:antitoxin ParD1/3/4 [Rhizobium sp. BK060]